ncbi:MAG: hypothetical protein ACI4PF_03580 [Christensenellales bacterium]
MQNLNAKKVNRFSKYYFNFIQLVVTGLLFLFVLNRELVLFVKEIISVLPVGANFIESIALKGYIIFNVLSNSPSIVILTLFIFHIVLFGYKIKIWCIVFCNPFIYNKEDLTCGEKKTCQFYRNNRTIYLENLRLLY